MPFGKNCEFPNWDACIAAMQSDGHDAEAAAKICGKLKNDTEERCRDRAAIRELLQKKIKQASRRWFNAAKAVPPIATHSIQWSEYVLVYDARSSWAEGEMMIALYSHKEGVWEDMLGNEIQPTHWMRLPKAPSAQEDDAKTPRDG